MEITDALDRFLQQLEANGRSPHTVGQYRRHIRLFARWAASAGLGGDLAGIGPEAVARFLTAPAARTRPDGGIKRATSQNALRSSLRGFFGYLQAAGHLERNPAGLVRRAMASGGPPRTVAPADRDRLLATVAAAEGPAARRDLVLYRLLLGTGLRLGSALRLDCQDVEFETGELVLRSVKGGRSERLPVSTAVLGHLRGFLQGRGEGPLFESRPGHRLTHRHAQRRLAQWLHKAGVQRPATMHSFRHTFATELYRATGDIALVKEALGHRSLASTLIYARADHARIRRAVEGLALSERAPTG